ncbi:MAG: heme-binding domain-containing protein [Leptospira sp.]|nr:heme-binding domain-containing protein [Leptospira sp.]
MVAKLYLSLGIVILSWGLVSYFTSPKLSNYKSDHFNVELSILSDRNTPDDVKQILRRACMDCHSYETRLPWYGYVFPVNYYLKDHIQDGLEDLNLSEWKNFSHKKKATIAYNITEELEAKTMPPKSYLFLHSDAEISQKDFETIEDWYFTLEKIYEKSYK